MSGNSRILVSVMNFRATAICTMVVCTMAGCATNTAPVGFLSNPTRAQTSTFGGWLDATYSTTEGDVRVAGELIAVTADSVWILNEDGGAVFAANSVIKGQMTAYDSEYMKVAGATALGVISTISNGVILIFTTPLWLIVGTAASASQSKLPVEKLPTDHWDQLARFARFPAGIPPGLRLKTLRMKE